MEVQNATNEKVKVFVVDDSPMMCKALRNIIAQDPSLEYVGHALDGKEALEMLSKTPCDICTFDVHMPVMNGITLLKHVMIRNPKPVLMLSAFTAEGARVTFEALRYGAVDFLQKPSGATKEEIDAQSEIIRTKLKKAAKVRVSAAQYLRLKKTTAQAAEQGTAPQQTNIVVIGAGTGGYASLLKLLPLLPVNFSGTILISLNASPLHVGAFVEYLKSYLGYPLVHGKDGDALSAGAVFLCSSQDRLILRHKDDSLFLQAKSSAEEESDGGIDCMMRSASELLGAYCLGILLSADGTDGLQGAKALKEKGAELWVQTPGTCLATELPQKIISLGGVKILTLSDMAMRLGR